MNRYRCYTCVLGLLLLASGAAAAATPGVEGTPPPVPSKPNWSSMDFLIGNWTCTDLSSRRPGPFTTTRVFKMDPTGYWMIRNDTIHTASWITHEVHTEYKTTWDRYTHRWVRIGTGEFGGYSVATASMPVAGKKTYTYVIQSKAPDIASYAPEVYMATSKTLTMTSSFTETNGRVVHVKETCTKNAMAM